MLPQRTIADPSSRIAGDQPSFECWRKYSGLPSGLQPLRTKFKASQKEWKLHEVLLSGWGTPIGELFDLEALAGHCRDVGRYTFFLTSEVCNVPGGVARYSPSCQHMVPT